jgi:hypothetical protein
MNNYFIGFYFFLIDQIEIFANFFADWKNMIQKLN